MALLQERVKRNEEKVEAIFRILDKTKDDKIEQDKKDVAKLAVENYKNNLINRVFRYLLIPIIILVIAEIINWVFNIYFRFYGG